MGVLKLKQVIYKERIWFSKTTYPNLMRDAKVQFRVISGKWNISDVSVVP